MHHLKLLCNTTLRPRNCRLPCSENYVQNINEQIRINPDSFVYVDFVTRESPINEQYT